MSISSRQAQDLEMMLAPRPEEAFDEANLAEWVHSRENWHTVFGQCTELIYEALREQDGIHAVVVFDFFNRAWWMSVRVIAYKEELTMDLAYKVLGYPPHEPAIMYMQDTIDAEQEPKEKQEEEGDDLPF